jgi:hypothetical protein
MKKIIIGIAILSVIMVVVMIYMPSKVNKIIKLNNLYKVPNVKVLNKPIFWKDELFFQTAEGISRYNLDHREVEEIKVIKGSFIFAFYQDSILTCRWENFLIDTQEDIATKIWIEDLEGHIFQEFKSSKTIKPITCAKDKLVTQDNYPNSLARYYEVDLRTMDIKETEYIENQIAFIEIDKNTSVKINSTTFEIDYPNIFTYSIQHEDTLVLIDTDMNLWVAY